MPELDFRAPRLFIDAPLKEGERVKFRMPPPYYPSKAEIFRVIEGVPEPAAVLEFGSDEYWQYIASGPEDSAVFKRIPAK